MLPCEDNRDPLEALAADFMERQRSGESPSIAEYAAKHPELAAEIEDLFPAIDAMERLKSHKEQESGARVSLGGVRMERLGDFLILREIGRGGMGIVYEAFQESLGRHVAVKVLPRQTLLDSMQLQRFQREAQTAAKLHHTNIVPVFGVGEHEGYHYIVMQLIRGVGLDALIVELGRKQVLASELREEARSSAATAEFAHGNEESRHAGGARQEPRSLGISSSQRIDAARLAEILGDGAAYWRSVASIGMQVSDALHYAHGHHTLHRDIKPANLLLDPQGVVWITDFGLAKAMEQDNVTQAGGMVGTLRYMAPEQFSGQADARSDIYNLGLTLYELLIFRPAFEESDRSSLIHKIMRGEPAPPRKIDSAIPLDLETIVLKAIAREPCDRYQTAGEMARDLQCFLEDRPIRARRSSAVERLWRWSRRNRAVATLAASTLLMLIAIAAMASVGYVLTSRANQEEKKLRTKAEETSSLAIEALDNIFQQFAPDHAATASSLQVVSDTGEKISVPVQPVLSKEAASLLESMLVFYDRLAKQGGDDFRLRQKVAEANRRVGDIRRRLGQYEESKTAYLHAAALYAKLAETSGETVPLAVEMAKIHNELGTVYCAMNQPEAGRSSYREALEKLKAIDGDASASEESRYELARTYYFLGKGPGEQQPGPPPLMLGGSRGPPPGKPDGPRLGPPRGLHRGPEPLPDFDEDTHGPPPDFPGTFPGGPWEEGNENLQKGIGLLEQLVGRHPETPDYRHLLARCYREISQQWFIRGSISAPDAAKRATDILQKLVKEYPDVPDYRYDLCETYLALEASRMFAMNPAELQSFQPSQATIEKALAISEELVAEHPNIPDYAISLIHIRLGLAFLHWDSDPAEAEKYMRKALDLQSLLVRRFPHISAYKFGKAFIQDSLSGFYQQRERLPEAQSLLQESIAGLKEALEEDPRARPLRGILGHNYQILADLLRRTGEVKGAEEAQRQAETLRPER